MVDSQDDVVIEAQSNSPIFKLPPEIRNVVYSFCFTHDTDRTIITNAYKPPALLSTCRQIRAEAAPLWSTAKTFEVELRDCNVKMHKTFMHQVLQSIEGDGDLTWDIILRINGVNWNKLLHWCKEVHSGALDPVTICSDPTDSWAVIQAALNLADFAKSMSWVAIESQLENLRMVALKVDSSWE